MEPIIAYLKIQVKRPGTIQIFSVGAVLLALALIVGVSDNPPGIMLAFLGLVLVFFAFVHHWREAGQFGTLLAVAVISFPVLVLLHNIFDGINDQIGSIIILNQLLTGLAVSSFLGAILLAPAAATVGLVAGLFYLLRRSSKRA